MASRPLQFERRELTVLTWFVLVAGITASILGSLAWRDYARDETHAELGRSSTELSKRLTQDVRRHDQALLSTAGLFAASNSVEEREFSAFATAVKLRGRFPEIRSVAWLRGDPASPRVRYATPREGWATPGRRLDQVVGLPTALRRARDGARSVLASTHLRPSGVRDDFVMVRPVYTEARTPRGLRLRRAGLLGWVALKLRGRGFLAEDMRTFAREGRAVLFSPQGEPVSWSTPGRVAPDIRSGAARHADVLDLQGGTWTLRTSTQEEREGAVDSAGPKVTLFVGLVLSVLLFALLRLRKRSVLEARRRTDDLRENEDRFQALTTSSPVGICLLDETEQCRYVNQRWADMHGIEPADALWKEPLPTLDPADRVAWEVALERGRQGEETSLECRLALPDGGVHWALYRGAPLRHESGEIRGWVLSAVDITDRKIYEAELKRRALHDELTGLPNRALLMEHLARAMAAGTRQRRSTGVLFIDLDRLSRVNDEHGRAAGDEIIRMAARRLDETVRPGDTVGRFAGDEFVVICEDVSDETDVVRIAERLVADLSGPTAVDGNPVSVTASIGIAFGGAGDDPGQVLRDADAARNKAKLRGGGATELFDTRLKTQAQRRAELENALREAIDHGDFEVHYQPLVELPARRAVGFEALVRWRRNGKLVGPNDFIPVAEENGLILPIGRWVLGEACEQAARWNAAPGDPVFVSVNVSARQIVEPGLPDAVAQALATSGLEPECLSLEITESLLLEPHGETLVTLERIERLGVRISMDDFGTGYSALSYLKRFPIHELKIDRAFVTDVARSDEDAELVAAIVAMAHALGFSVVAEGVETEEQLDALQDLDVTRAQGYLFSRPVPAAEAGELLAAGRVVGPVAP